MRIRILNLILLFWNQMRIRSANLSWLPCESPRYEVTFHSNGLRRIRGSFRSPMSAFLWAITK